MTFEHSSPTPPEPSNGNVFERYLDNESTLTTELATTAMAEVENPEETIAADLGGIALAEEPPEFKPGIGFMVRSGGQELLIADGSFDGSAPAPME